MTQAELARAAGTRERNVIRWENGQHAPRLENVIAVAQATGKPLAFFVEDDSEEADEPMSREERIHASMRPLARELARGADRA